MAQADADGQEGFQIDFWRSHDDADIDVGIIKNASHIENCFEGADTTCPCDRATETTCKEGASLLTDDSNWHNMKWASFWNL